MNDKILDEQVNKADVKEKNIEERVIEVVAEKLGAKKQNITVASRFQEDLGADSLDIVELLMDIEDKFQVSISDDESEQLKTVGDAVKFISSKM